MTDVQKIRLFIFQRDLRVWDNTALLAAVEHAREEDDIVLPIFIFDPAQIDAAKNKWRSAACQTFMIQSLLELAEEFKELRAGFCTLYGDPAGIIRSIASSAELSGVYCHIDFTPFSKARRAGLESAALKFGVEYFEYNDYLLLDEFINVGSAAEDETKPYKVFGAFYKATRLKRVRKPANDKKVIEDAPWISPAAAKKFIAANIGKSGEIVSIKDFMPDINAENVNIKYVLGGRSAAVGILNSLDKLGGLFGNTGGCSIEKYAAGRDLLSCSQTHLSAYMKFGCVSIREVYWKFKEAIKNNESKEVILRQLYWRDFFYNLIWSDTAALTSSFDDRFEKIKWVVDAAEVKKRVKIWKEGRTGFPIVDAAMNEIAETHYMHNRTRMIVASFLTKHLLIYWRHGEKYFAKQLVDYDPAINNLNWQSVLGSGPFALDWFRVMNPWRQSLNHDSEAEYIKKWLPQLKDVPAKHLHNWNEHWQEYDLKKINYWKPVLDQSHQKEIMMKKFKKVLRGGDEAADVENA